MARTAKYGLAPYGPQKPDALFEFDVDPSATAIYIGDIVKIVADKGVAQVGAGNEDNCGVAVGFLDSDGIPQRYYSAGDATGWKCIVNIDPYQTYMVHYYHATTALTDVYVGSTADIVVGTGSTVTGLSGGYVTALSTGAANLYVLGLAPLQGNEWGTDCELLVKLQEHIFKNVAAAGV